MALKGESDTKFMCTCTILHVCRYFFKTVVPKALLCETVKQKKSPGKWASLFVGFSFQALTLVNLLLTEPPRIPEADTGNGPTG